jgi:hypothetical protein
LLPNNLEDLQPILDQLTLEEKAKLINGISMEAAHILKKILPNSPVVDMLITTKSRFSKL